MTYSNISAFTVSHCKLLSAWRLKGRSVLCYSWPIWSRRVYSLFPHQRKGGFANSTYFNHTQVFLSTIVHKVAPLASFHFLRKGMCIACSLSYTFIVETLQYGSVEVFLRIVNHADSETQSMVRVSPLECSRYRFPLEDFWPLTVLCYWHGKTVFIGLISSQFSCSVPGMRFYSIINIFIYHMSLCYICCIM